MRGILFIPHENIIYILMPEPEEHNLERTTPNRCCNIDEQRRSAGSEPAS